ncbi:MAG: hypothetical protein EA394_04595 [Bacteroidia bacterium]|nr:MAG: hypothetical protein EA394_04595 [Bacteroidia bacterium]
MCIKWSDHKHALYFLPALLWAGFIFGVISMPPDSIPEVDALNIPHVDKVIHFKLFCVFSLWLLFGFSGQQKNKPLKRQKLLIVFSIAILFGILTELFQYCCLKERHGSIPDMLANGFGTVFGMFLYSKFCTKQKTG